MNPDSSAYCIWDLTLKKGARITFQEQAHNALIEIIIVCVKGGALNISALKRTLGCFDFYSHGTSKVKVWMVVKGKHKPEFNCYSFCPHGIQCHFKACNRTVSVQIDSVSTTGIKLDYVGKIFRKRNTEIMF